MNKYSKLKNNRRNAKNYSRIHQKIGKKNSKDHLNTQKQQNTKTNNLIEYYSEQHSLEE